jgi:hypothetical protein
MKKVKVVFLVLLFLCLSMSMPPISFSAEEPSEPISIIYLKDGGEVKCDMAWIEGDTLVYRRYGGTMGIPLKTVNLDKTFKRAKGKEQADGTYQSGEFTIYNLTYNEVPFYDRKLKSGETYRHKGPYWEIKYMIQNDGNNGQITVKLVGLDSNGTVIGSADQTHHVSKRSTNEGKQYYKIQPWRKQEIAEWRIDELK